MPAGSGRFPRACADDEARFEQRVDDRGAVGVGPKQIRAHDHRDRAPLIVPTRGVFLRDVDLDDMLSTSHVGDPDDDASALIEAARLCGTAGHG